MAPVPTLPSRPLMGARPAAARDQSFDVAVALALLLALGAGVAVVATSRPLLALGLPVLAIGGVLAARRPAPAVIIAMFLSGTANTVSAFTPLPAVPTIEFMLAITWLGVLGGVALGDRRMPLWLWPGLIAPALYILLTFLEIFVAESIGNAIEGFRLSTWYMAAFLLVALAPWPADTLRRICRGFAAVTALVGSYCLFRFFVGPSGSEEALARATALDLPASTSLRFYGSFISANQLAAWTAVTIPFTLALVLGWRGPWRLVALIGLATCAFAVLASDVRTGTIAAVAAIAVVIGLYAFAQAFPATRIVHAAGAVLTLSMLGYVAYSETVAKDPESKKRFENLLTPSDDYAYAVRENTWDIAWKSIRANPWGSGLGTSGGIGQTKNEGGPAGGVYNVDNSYLKIALEQGLLVMAFFIASLVVLLASLAWRAVTVVERERATLAIGACGTLVALLILFYAGIYIENVAALMGWFLIGIGAAQFTRGHESPAATADQDPARDGAKPGHEVAPQPAS